MNTAEFLDNISQTFATARELVARKNMDYAGDNDPFKNFRADEVVGVPTERGILVRIKDKLLRISNLVDSSPLVNDEKVEDSILDAINYLAILKAYLDDRRKKAIIDNIDSTL